jgi:pyruvate/2-oxoacid:ferredoxin oxidoreductase beta subunit
MNIQSKLKTIGFAFAIAIFGFACNTETRNDTNEAIDEAQRDVTAGTVEADREVSQEYNEFTTWVNTNTRRADNVTADEYREMRAEYKRREAEINAETANWDDETRREWEETKREWNEFENNVQKRLGKIDDIDVDVDVKRDNR